ncbi:MAG: hypothetical protein NWF10_01410 [Candidatus Bathyarchaeota archaeon]|jgi:hypothetical protein|nr:hypothetical protein [Candidatus Bathyarchaeota archaeon]
MNYTWNKAVLTFYREKHPPKREPFAVVKTEKLEISRSHDNLLTGEITGFFPLMGNLDSISSVEGLAEKYVICWFDDTVDDMNIASRRLTGVSFSSNFTYVADKKGKRTYKTHFTALAGKLK